MGRRGAGQCEAIGAWKSLFHRVTRRSLATFGAPKTNQVGDRERSQQVRSFPAAFQNLRRCNGWSRRCRRQGSNCNSRQTCYHKVPLARKGAAPSCRKLMHDSFLRHPLEREANRTVEPSHVVWLMTTVISGSACIRKPQAFLTTRDLRNANVIAGKCPISMNAVAFSHLPSLTGECARGSEGQRTPVAVLDAARHLSGAGRSRTWKDSNKCLVPLSQWSLNM
jgi:hypothetical protein